MEQPAWQSETKNGRARSADSPSPHVKGSAEPRGVVPRSQDAVDKIAAEALGSFCAATAYFAAARRLIASGSVKGESLPVAMPYTRSGRRRLARLLRCCTYRPCEGALEAADIEDGTRVILGLTVPASAISIRHDDWRSIEVFVGEALPASVVVALGVRVCRIGGRTGVVLEFVCGAGGRNSAPASHQKCFIMPGQLFRLMWVLSQETDISVLSSECQNEAQTEVLVEPIRRLANRLQAGLPEAEPLDVAAIDRRALAAVLAARTMVQRSSAEDRGVSPRTVRLARKRLLEIDSAVDTIARSGQGVSLEMLAYAKSRAALCRQTSYHVDVLADADGAEVMVDVCWGSAEEDYQGIWSRRIARSVAPLGGMVKYGGAAYSAKLLILSAVALAGQPPQTLAGMAGQTARLCCIAETYYRVWHAVRSVCALEFVADAV